MFFSEHPPAAEHVITTFIASSSGPDPSSSSSNSLNFSSPFLCLKSVETAKMKTILETLFHKRNLA